MTGPEIDAVLNRLKVSPRDPDIWRSLGHLYLKDGDSKRAEIAYLGALYQQTTDLDTQIRWFSVYESNRHDRLKNPLSLKTALRTIGPALTSVRENDERLTEELGHCITYLEKGRVFR